MHHDETEKNAHNSYIVRGKEKLKLSHGGPCHSQASGTNPPIKLYVRAVIESEAWPNVLQLKWKP